jgi:hypothetical protein
MDYKIHSVLICDDVRKEDNGKEILIGVYTNKLMTNTPPPIQMAKLCFWILCTMNFTGKRNMALEIISPSRDKIMGGSGKIDTKHEGKTSVVLPFFSVQLPEVGVYSIKFGIDQPLRKIGGFEVEYVPK